MQELLEPALELLAGQTFVGSDGGGHGIAPGGVVRR
jgi:hypothetical protein